MEHPPHRGCDRGATKPGPKSDATLRAAVLFGKRQKLQAQLDDEGNRALLRSFRIVNPFSRPEP
jgi:hypothetical protein